MRCFRFRLDLADERGVADDPSGEKLDDLANELFEAGCDDGSPGVFRGRLEVSFSREAETMVDAVRSAMSQVESTGCRVLRVMSPDQPIFDGLNEEIAARENAGTAAGA